jgi:hypothetical protein
MEHELCRCARLEALTNKAAEVSNVPSWLLSDHDDGESGPSCHNGAHIYRLSPTCPPPCA